jgi:hypothetical protein
VVWPAFSQVDTWLNCNPTTSAIWSDANFCIKVVEENVGSAAPL